jgi:Na+-translocating ferredoxin:NAD+ oxidoreductase RNF subunit RnfB
MAYVITPACTKDELCVEACPVDCIHPKKDEDGFEATLSFSLILASASTAVPASRFARHRPFTQQTTFRRIRRPAPTANAAHYGN